MNNKTVKGYWSNGRFVKPEEILAEEQGPPSKTQLKAEADEKQALGEALLTLRPDLIKRLDLPEKLLDAIKDCKKITNFEGRRRQMQFIGKLMRLVEPSVLDEVRTALNDQLGGSAQDKLRLHQAELWRDRLLLDDDALGAWLTAHTDTDAQQLRALIRQARKDAQPEKPGAAVRHGRAYRDVFQIVRERLERVPEPEADTAIAHDADQRP